MGAVELSVIVAMIAFNSFFAAYEIALAAVSPARLQFLAGEKRPGASAAVYMKANVEASLSAIQLGITLFGAIAAATGGAGAEESIAPWLEEKFNLSTGTSEFLAVVAIVIPLTAFTIVLGELVPKVFALRNKEWVCLKLSPPMRWFTFSVWPAVWMFETVVSGITDWGERRFRKAAGEAKPEATELQELRAVAALARASRVIGAREERIIHTAAQLAARPVREIIVPATRIGMLWVETTLANAMRDAHLDMHTRYPVTEKAGDPQRIIGYANFKDIVAAMQQSPDQTLRGITRPIDSFLDSESLAHCLEQLIRANAHIALVRDSAGNVTGLITLEDVVEEFFGDIGDEYDRLPEHMVSSGATWLVGGGVAMPGLRAALDVPILPDSEGHLLADWIASRLGRPPRGGDLVEMDGLRVTVRKVRRNRLVEAQVARA